jgi:hypothetical protein
MEARMAVSSSRGDKNRAKEHLILFEASKDETIFRLSDFPAEMEPGTNG